jgi:hypothetical protein
MPTPALSHKMTGNRISLLPVSRYCGSAGRLAEETNVGQRAAVMSSAVHARAAGDTELFRQLWLGLAEEERQTIETWQDPTDVDLGNGTVLRLVDAEKELLLGLDDSGNPVDPTTQDVFTRGTMDLGWVVGNVAYIADMKRSRYTTSDTESLQCHGYAQAYARLRGCKYYVVGLFYLEEGEWYWSDRAIKLSSGESLDIWEQLHHAISNRTTDFTTGAHCRECYSRRRCPAYLLPAALRATDLAPFAKGNEEALADPAKVAQAVLFAQQLQELATAALEQAKALAEAGMVIQDPGTGKVYRGVLNQGRRSVSVADAERVAPEIVKQGKPYKTYRWVKG